MKSIVFALLFISIISIAQETETQEMGNFKFENNKIFDKRNDSILATDIKIIKTAYSHNSLVVVNNQGLGFGEDEWLFFEIKNIQNLIVESTGDYDVGIVATEKDTIYVNFLEKRLTKLPAYSNIVRELEGDIKNNIYHLDLSDQELKEIPKEIFQLNNLINLELWRNSIKSIPAEIKNLKNLEKLIISQNNLTEIPKEILSLENLYELNLRYNSIRNLPEEIKNLKNLKILDLRENPLPNAEIEKIRKLFEGTDCKINLPDINDFE